MSVEAIDQALPRKVLSPIDPAIHTGGELPASARVGFLLAVLVLITVLAWQALTSGGSPDPLTATTATSGVIDIAVLVFREGLECVLVIAAITASLVGKSEGYRKPITVGIVVAAIATLITWQLTVGLLTSLSESYPMLQLQAITGLLAIVVLLIVMNWFFHKVYWTGWISMHNRRKKNLIAEASTPGMSKSRLFIGFMLLGFTSLYREGFEVVLFLQSYRIKLGSTPVLKGVVLGLLLSGIVAVIAFVANHRLPFRKMLVVTGVMLGVVLLVMVGEQAQEMQLAGWISATPITALDGAIPAWLGLWFAVFPNVEGLALQGVALVLVLGSYLVVRLQHNRAMKQVAVMPAVTGELPEN